MVASSTTNGEFMIRKSVSATGLMVGTIAAIALLAVSTPASAQHETVLYNFGLNGTEPLGLVLDAKGSFYGTTYQGRGDYLFGTVLELSPAAGGGWRETVLHTFGRPGDGMNPQCTLIFDKAGNLYGTTFFRGRGGNGVVFELSPAADGSWSETILHSFANNGKDGLQPVGGLIFDASGNLYGTTTAGGTLGLGSVFELQPASGGIWTEKVIYSFGLVADGDTPTGSLVLDGSGNLYGTTALGGVNGTGTVFELKAGEGGTWAERILHTFGSGQDGDGANVSPGVVRDASGNLYGTTSYGGANLGGTVFELSPTLSGKWREEILLNCNYQGRSPQLPVAGVVFDASGNLYATTGGGGTYGAGTVLELKSAGNGNWLPNVLQNFNGSDGSYPFASLILDRAGNLYGTTYQGGAYGWGTVFEITP
jgi:uncharacterized repeat protein (TIGR03803 family)